MQDDSEVVKQTRQRTCLFYSEVMFLWQSDRKYASARGIVLNGDFTVV